MVFCLMYFCLYKMFFNLIFRFYNILGYGVEFWVYINKEFILVILGYWNWDFEEWDDYEMVFLFVIVN